MAFSLAVPSPVRRVSDVAGEHAEIWLKDDGLLHPLYGGNKVRKLPAILARAQVKGARRILTFGPAGSHHVLTTALLAKEYGLPTVAVLSPQPATPHARDVLRAIVAQGVEVHPASTIRAVPWIFSRAFRFGDYVVPPGGSNPLGALAYADAVSELRAQIAVGALPEPDVIVVALGSGGTAAGLLAGVVEHGLRAKIVAVQTVSGHIARPYALYLAKQVLRQRGVVASGLGRRLRVERGQLGPGYGVPTPASRKAADRAEELGFPTDPTYTAKALAHALELTKIPEDRGRRSVVLYWHTLSCAPMGPLLSDAPPFELLPAPLGRLLAPMPDVVT